MLELIAFDADDTLWHSEIMYSRASERFKQILAPYHDAAAIEQRLYQVEMRNLQYYGYGIKGFALSLIETALELSEERITGAEIRQVLDLARGMLTARIELLDHAQECLAALAKGHPLMLITKGDLLDQEAKIARSGLKDYFRHIEIVSDKTPQVYAGLLARHGVESAHFLMVGNSPRSDILPVLELGGYAICIPYQVLWSHEKADVRPEDRDRYFELEHLGLVPAVVDELDRLEPG